MARKGKTGLDYFSHDVHMRSDPKIRFIKAKHGFIAYGIYNALLEEIYLNGYFIENGEKFNILFADENKIDLNVFINVLNDCIEEGLFDRDIYKKYGILTSKRIQLNYIAGAERRNAIEFTKEYLLIVPENEVNDKFKENVCILSLNANILLLNADKSTQSKVKEIESKVDKIEIEKFFDECWILYPRKEGKGSVSDTKKKELFILSEEIKRCIQRYKDKIEKDKIEKKYIKQGSTFFNSGYIDYLDKNYTELIEEKESWEGFN